MKTKIFSAILLSPLLVFSAPAPKPVPADFVQRMDSAMPTQTPAKPTAERRLLVFYLAKGFKHDSIGTANQCFERMGQKTGAFTVDFSSDMGVFTPERLAGYDAILFNNTTGLNFDEPGTREALMEFVKGGKGIIGIHAATDSFYGWPEGAGMMGGLFDSHPWHAGGTWRICVTDPDHVCNEGFKGETTFLLKDEIYQLRSPYNRKDRRLLLELDAFAAENQNVKGKKRDDDFGISWLKPFGHGRVFYCSLGHNHEVYWNTAVLDHYLAGIQYALGDLKAPDSPASPQEAPEIVALRGWKAGEPNEPIVTLAGKIPALNEAGRLELEKALMTILSAPDATADGRDEALQLLARMGSALSVPAVSSLLDDARLGSRAMWALDRNPSDEATAALRHALANGSDAMRIAAATSLASRRAIAAIPDLAAAVQATPEPVARAAIEALGRLGIPALDALQKLEPAAPLLPAWEQAILRSADESGKAGMDALRALLAKSGNPHVQGACMALLGREGDAAPVISALRNDSRFVWQPALAVVRQFQTPEAAESLGRAFADIPAHRLPALLQSIAHSGNAAFAAHLTALFESNDPAIRSGAIQAVATLDAPTHLAALLEIAARPEEVGKVAFTALAESPANLAPLLLQALPGCAPDEQSLLLTLLAARNDRSALPELLKAAVSGDPRVNRPAANAVALMGGIPEYQSLLQAVTATAALRPSLIPVLRTLGTRLPDASAAVNAIFDAMQKGLPLQEGCLLLGAIKSPAAEARLVELATRASPESARIILRELGTPSSPEALRALIALAQSSPDAAIQSLALRNVARALPKSALPMSEKSAAIDALYTQASSMEDRKALISATSAALHPVALTILRKAEQEPELAAEAEGLRKAILGAGWPQVEVKGTTTFRARVASVQGKGAAYESGPNRDCIGNWSNPEAWVFWVANNKTPGKYKISIEHSCHTGEGGADVDFIVAGQKFPFKVVETGGWDKFPTTELGVVELPMGFSVIEVRPRNRPKSYVMNLRSVTLTPVE